MASKLLGEILKVVFPFLNGEDLVNCMLVCRQWREIARDDYYWKCLCKQKWPSICRQPPPDLSYLKLYRTFYKPKAKEHLTLPPLSFNNLILYIDLWSEDTLIFSQAVPGSNLRQGLKTPPPDVPVAIKEHLECHTCKMIVPTEPRLNIARTRAITISILVSRMDNNKMASIMHKGVFDYFDHTAFRAMAFEYLKFSPQHPFISRIRAWASLLFLVNGGDMDVYAIEIDFCDAANSETEILWIFEVLDWK